MIALLCVNKGANPEDLRMTDKTITTYDEIGRALTETQGDVTMPANYSFACVIDYVHCHDTNYEDLQCLALGMASYIEKVVAALDKLCANGEPVCDCLEFGQMPQKRETVENFRAALDNGWPILKALHCT